MTKQLLSDLRYYSIQMLKESIFLLFLGFDVIGVLLAYFTSLTPPYWIYVLVFILGVFFGGFNIYRKGAADIRIELSDEPDAFLCIGLTRDELIYDFTISGYFVNFGLQSGVLESITPSLWANGIKDDYVLERIYTYRMLPVHKGKISPQLLHDNKYGKSNNHFEFPIALMPGTIEPFTIGIRIHITTEFGQDRDEAFEEFVEWLEKYELLLRYKVRQNNGSNIREVYVNIPKSILSNLGTKVLNA